MWGSVVIWSIGFLHPEGRILHRTREDCESLQSSSLFRSNSQVRQDFLFIQDSSGEDDEAVTVTS